MLVISVLGVVGVTYIFGIGFPLFEGLGGSMIFVFTLALIALCVFAIMGTLDIKNGKSDSAFWKLLVTSIIALPFTLGFVIGPILGIATAIMIKKK